MARIAGPSLDARVFVVKPTKNPDFTTKTRAFTQGA